MTVDPRRSPPALSAQRETPAAGKKQTSLLSFFPTPSPKRPAGGARDADQHDRSPTTKRTRDFDTLDELGMTDAPDALDALDTLDALPSSAAGYEMVSEDDDAAALSASTAAINLAQYSHDAASHAEAQLPRARLRVCRGSAALSLSLDSAADEGSEQRDASNERYAWLVNVRDIDGRPPSTAAAARANPLADPQYDPRTLHIPKAQWARFTPFERQFWEIKCRLYDTVVFFKKGKFYELYENDADIGAREFDLKMVDRVNMRMVGVPEATFESWAARFVAAGFKIARVDQTENAIGKSIREKDTDARSEKIIRRELSCILTAGTVTEPAMLGSDAGSAAPLCITIKEQIVAAAGDAPAIGVAILDAPAAAFHLSDFTDDRLRSTLETLLMQLRPKEVIVEKGRVSPETLRTIRNLLPTALLTEATPEREFWSPTKTADELDIGRYFEDGVWPAALRDSHVSHRLSFLAFGALLSHLSQLRLDRTLLSYRNFARFDPIRAAASLVLDGQTLLNLDIIPSALRSAPSSAADARKGTLLAVVDQCRTAFGGRLLLHWLCHPLRAVDEINARLDVVDFFIAEPGLAAATAQSLAALPDLERSLSRIHSGAIKLRDFIHTMDALRQLLALRNAIVGHGSRAALPALLARVLAEIPDYAGTIEYFYSEAFDRPLALREGSLIPYAGVEAEYDQAEGSFAAVQCELQSYLKTQETLLRLSGLRYRDVGKEIFQLEVPADAAVPKEYVLMSKTKAVKRYWTPAIREMVKRYQEREERRSGVLRSLYGKILARFDSHASTWRAAVGAAAKLDCLLSLADGSARLSEPKCRPVLVESAAGRLEMEELRHPCIPDHKIASFIPNDLVLGTEDSGRIVVLTGPNMGGKSTILRQTCLAVVMAQLGFYVPARRCTLAPLDRIFARLGANDNIMAGESTFMVELLDTAKILREATCRSLVILDELGRGTSTFDGMAIAHAVLLHLARVTRCIGLFATHYRPLAVDFAEEPAVACKFMLCAADSAARRATFLYKLTPGVSPKSYGMNVASMAGIPQSVIEQAESVADRFDASLTLTLTLTLASDQTAEAEAETHSKSRRLARLLIDVLCRPRAAPQPAS